ncbi:hypothetical protein M0R72_05915 [Candidatus Pacearchaeota archaeon]|nr:hypothetical protein [Candidatus Pacearchaeota archaeon]
MIDRIKNLRNLIDRRQAIIIRRKETGTPNHGLLEQLDIERDIINAAPEMSSILSEIRAGDEDRICNVISLASLCSNMSEPPEFDEEDLDCLRRLAAMVAKAEAGGKS